MYNRGQSLFVYCCVCIARKGMVILKNAVLLVLITIVVLLLCSCNKNVDSIYGLEIERNVSNCNYTEEMIVDIAEDTIKGKYSGYANPSALYFTDGNWLVFFFKEPIEQDDEELRVVINDSTGKVTVQ